MVASHSSESSLPSEAPSGAQPTVQASEAGSSEKENKENKAFGRWRKTLSLITGMGLSPEEFQAEIEKADRKTCELYKEQLIKTSTLTLYHRQETAWTETPLCLC